MRKLAILVDTIGPYHAARIDAVTKIMDVLVIEQRKRSLVYNWDPLDTPSLNRTTLTCADSKSLSSVKVFRNIADLLTNFQPDAVAISGWATLQSMLTLLWAHYNYIPLIIMSESQEKDFPRYWYKEIVKRAIVSKCNAAFVGGKNHRHYVEKLGMLPSQVMEGYDVVDNSYFKSSVFEYRLQDSVSEIGIGISAPFFLCVSRFIPKKNIEALLDAYAEYNAGALKAKENPWNLVLVGDGPLYQKYQEQIIYLGIQEWVHLTGFKQYCDLPKYYAAAGCLILPSRIEPWGLVVNEAMASGLPVLVSNRCGCANDLVRNGVNGYTFDPFNTTELSRCMLQIQEAVTSTNTMGVESIKIISEYSTNNFAFNLSSALEIAVRSPPKSRNLFIRLLYLTFHTIAYCNFPWMKR